LVAEIKEFRLPECLVRNIVVLVHEMHEFEIEVGFDYYAKRYFEFEFVVS